ncbi:MAG TPA: hypothetical protein VK689_07715 [Armatimonadota bacterium]|nr:hypothetical protein [Armatimonadota bacterium]
MEQSDPKRGGRAWILWAMGVVAVAAVVGGTAMTLRTLGAAPVAAERSGSESKMPEGGQDTADKLPTSPPQPLVHGQKKPAAFGLPSYPSAHDFQSMEAGKAHGSVSFPVREGTAADIMAFYRRELSAAGWKLLGERKAEADLGGKRPFPGFRAEWAHPDRDRQLTLLALDHPARPNASQAVISWSALTHSSP